ncbi:hypothetical protein PMAYCL1PPCAC_24685, partial [Pristionchus mayeri]
AYGWKWQLDTYSERIAVNDVSCISKEDYEEMERKSRMFLIFFVGGWRLFTAVFIIFVVCHVSANGGCCCEGCARRRFSCSGCACCH